MLCNKIKDYLSFIRFVSNRFTREPLNLRGNAPIGAEIPRAFTIFSDALNATSLL